jgi:plastocyanin
VEEPTVTSTAAEPDKSRTRVRRSLAVAALAASVIAAGCGGSSSSSSSSSAPAATPSTSAAPSTGGTGAGSTLSLEANTEGQLKYNTSSLTAKAGTVSIAFKNSASLEHNVTVASSSGAVVGATPTFAGGTKTLTVSLKPGVYKFYCTVPGHRAAGMEGTLTVK